MIHPNPRSDAEILSTTSDNGSIGVKVRETAESDSGRKYERFETVWIWAEDLTGEESEGDIEIIALEKLQDQSPRDEWQLIERKG